MTTVEFEGRRYEFPKDATRDEIVAFLDARSSKEPVATTQRSEPPAPAAPPRVPGAAGALNWAASNPQGALDMLLSGGLSAAGTAAGSPAGPAGSIALGGAGAAAGKRIARDIGSLAGFPGSEEYPSTGESTLDAAAGGAGPALSAVARPATRALTGVSKEAASKVSDAHQVRGAIKSVTDEVKHGKSILEKAAGTSAGSKKFAEEIAELAREAGHLADKVPDAAIKRTISEIAKGAGKLPDNAGKLGALIMGVAHGDITSAALLFGAGFGASKVRMAAARRLLRSERAVEWIMERAKGGITPTALLTSLSGLAAVKGLDASTRADIRTLQGEGESEGLRGDRDALERMMDGDGEGDE